MSNNCREATNNFKTDSATSFSYNDRELYRTAKLVAKMQHFTTQRALPQHTFYTNLISKKYLREHASHPGEYISSSQMAHVWYEALR